MLTINKLLPAGRGLAPVLLKRAATVELDWDVRQKSRFDAVDSTGRALGVFLPRGVLVRGGDVLIGEDGSFVKVVAAPQPVLVVRACADHGSPFDLVRAAYHLGNRHVPLELKPDHLKLEPDHVLGDMLRMMHLIVTQAEESFEPEGGAYTAETAAGGHGRHEHGHKHGGHGHDHGGQHDHARGHDHGTGDHGHDHDHDRDHDHDHAHGNASAGAPAGEHRHEHDHSHSHGDASPGGSAEKDRFGRDRSDPHFGHNHR
jgi:urease accessory protein